MAFPPSSRPTVPAASLPVEPLAPSWPVRAVPAPASDPVARARAEQILPDVPAADLRYRRGQLQAAEWVAVGDERLSAATIAHAHGQAPLVDLGKLTLEVPAWLVTAYRQAVAGARADGLAWTPLLDALDATATLERTAAAARGFVTVLDLAALEVAPDPAHPSAPDLLAPLAAHIAAEAAPTQLAALLYAFRSPTLAATVARHATTLTPAIARELVGPRGVGPALVQNPALAAPIRDAIARESATVLATAEGSVILDGVDGGPYARACRVLEALGQREGGLAASIRATLWTRLRWHREAANDPTGQQAALRTVLAHDAGLTAADVLRLADGVEPLVAAHLVLHPALSDHERRQLLVQGRRAPWAGTASTLLYQITRPLPPNILRLLVEEFALDKNRLGAIAHHACATTDTWLAILELADPQRGATAVAHEPAARRDPVVRACLRDSRVLDVQQRLAEDGDLDDLARSLPGLLKHRPLDALALLEGATLPPGFVVPRAAFQALLRSTKEPVRFAAARLLNRVHAHLGDPPPAARAQPRAQPRGGPRRP